MSEPTHLHPRCVRTSGRRPGNEGGPPTFAAGPRGRAVGVTEKVTLRCASCDTGGDDPRGRATTMTYNRAMATRKTETAEERRRRGLEAIERLRELRREMPVLDAVSLIREVRDEADEEPAAQSSQ